MSSGVLGLSLVHWSIYSTVFDLPSVLSRLVGLGYSVGRAQFVGGDVVVEYLVDEAMNNVIAKRRLENDNIRVLYDGGRRAIGVVGGSRDSLTVGLSELYRALSESKVPELPVTELYPRTLLSVFKSIIMSTSLSMPGALTIPTPCTSSWGMCAIPNALLPNRSLTTT